jgi:hypothetical protein
MMIENAVVLAALSFVGGLLIWNKLPRFLKRWLKRLDLVTDVGLFILAYIVLGGTATALLASAMLGVMVSGALFIGKHPARFTWIHKLISHVKQGSRGNQSMVVVEKNDGQG